MPKTVPEAGTNEACAFSDNYEGFETLNARVIRIDSDSVEWDRKFAEKHYLPFTLVQSRIRAPTPSASSLVSHVKHR
jgi:peroxiredoxin